MEQDELQGRLAYERAQAGRGYSAELRERVVEYARRRGAEGGSGWRVADELGVPWPTLRRWLVQTTAFLPVEVSPVGSQAGVVIHGPRGLWIEGADARFVAELLLALS